MRKLALLSLPVAAVFALAVVSATPKAQAQISVGVQIGAEPNCPYGYYDYAPYNCAPYGYYGPEWFVGGRFVGAGKWFHGPAGFHGTVNNHYDPQHGYHGAMPHPNDKPEPGHGQAPKNFHGNESRDGHGPVRR